MIEYVHGDFFDYEADIRINTVNCVGVMGAGVALAFKKRYQQMYKHYVLECKSGNIHPGKPMVWEEGDIFSSQNLTIINFPTKKHWRNPSKYEYIESGLQWLREFLQNRPDKVVTLPALGCGHGGLDWKKVKELINNYLSDSSARILVFEPSSSIKTAVRANFDAEILEQLYKLGIDSLPSSSAHYPQNLKTYTDRQLFVYNTPKQLNYDFTIIASSKPDILEGELIKLILHNLQQMQLSVIFGGSALDKKLCIKYVHNGGKSASFIPAGIIDSVEKIKTKNLENITLISMGDPKKSFDRKEYIPSVIGRALLAKTVIFTTPRLSWVKKHKKHFINIDTFFIDYPSLETQEVDAMNAINALPLDSVEDQLKKELKQLTTRPLTSQSSRPPSAAAD